MAPRQVEWGGGHPPATERSRIVMNTRRIDRIHKLELQIPRWQERSKATLGAESHVLIEATCLSFVEALRRAAQGDDEALECVEHHLPQAFCRIARAARILPRLLQEDPSQLSAPRAARSYLKDFCDVLYRPELEVLARDLQLSFVSILDQHPLLQKLDKTRNRNLAERFFEVREDTRWNDVQHISDQGFDVMRMELNPVVKDFLAHGLTGMKSDAKFDPTLILTMKRRVEDCHFVLYHGTDDAGARAIERSSINTRLGNGEFGRGFYVNSTLKVARDWARMRQGHTGGAPVVLQITLPSRLVASAHPHDSLLCFPEYPAGKLLGAYDNFVRANQSLWRVRSKTSPVDKIHMILGPSISNLAKTHFLQLKFGPTTANIAMFGDPSITIKRVDT